MIAMAAEETRGVGAIAETVKWGNPSFTPEKPKIGSSVRLENRAGGDMALMFICHTGLVDEFREIYADVLTFEGNRAIVLRANEKLPENELRHCVALAFTYHLRKRAR